MEEFRESFTEKELSAELSKDAKSIDYRYLLRRAGNQQAMRRIFHVAEDELRHSPGGEDKWRQSVNEFYASHNPDNDGQWWMVTRLNELMGSPLKLNPLPDWDKAKSGS
jgi:hypothetical protein